MTLAARLGDTDTGEVLLGGVDMRQLDPALLWRAIGYVPQRAYLFSETVASNLRYGRPDTTDPQIIEAAQVTYVNRFVHSLPDGHDTVINEEAGNISTGQKQFLTTARAFLADQAT